MIIISNKCRLRKINKFYFIIYKYIFEKNFIFKMDLNVKNIINDELVRLIDIPQEESQYKIDI